MTWRKYRIWITLGTLTLNQWVTPMHKLRNKDKTIVRILELSKIKMIMMICSKNKRYMDWNQQTYKQLVDQTKNPMNKIMKKLISMDNQ